VISHDNKGVAPIAGASVGALAAAGFAAGPVGIVAAAIVGAVVADASKPDPVVVAYVRANPVEPVYLDGEVVVGSGIPDTVTLYKVPDSDYSYLWVNGVPVIVEPGDRKVVTILR
jgi:hypothetical protein